MEKGQAPLDPVDEEEVTRPEAQGRAFQQETPPVTVGDSAVCPGHPESGVLAWRRQGVQEKRWAALRLSKCFAQKRE